MSTTTTLNSKQYPVCKDSRVTWIGHIPDHWEVGNLRYFTRPLDGARIPLSAEQRGTMQGTIPYWGANSVIDHVNDWIFNEPLVLVGEDGAPFQDPYREVAFFVDEKVWVNNHIHVIRCGNRLNSKFFTYVLNTVDYTNFISGSTRDKLTQQDLGNIPIQVPPISEQAAIVRYLDDAEQRIRAYVSAKERLIALLEEERQAVIHQAVTRGLDPNVKLKPSGVEWLGDVPEQWTVRRLKTLCSMKSGDGITTEAIEPTGRYPVYGGNGLRGYTTEFTHDGHYALIGRQGALCGNVHTAQGKFWASEHAVVASPHSANNMEWFVALLEAMNLNQYSISAAQPGIAVERIVNLWAPFPPHREQSGIGEYIAELTATINDAIDRARRQIELVEEYRIRLIADVVTGTMDVR